MASKEDTDIIKLSLTDFCNMIDKQVTERVLKSDLFDEVVNLYKKRTNLVEFASEIQELINGHLESEGDGE